MSGFRVVLTSVGTGEDGVGPSLLLEMGSGATCSASDGDAAKWRSPLEHVVDAVVVGSVGEGMRRCCNEHHLKITAARTALISTRGPQHVSGLASVAFQLADSGCRELAIVGPHGTAAEVDTVRRYCRVRQPALPVLEAVVEQATGCTMLIHEATFSDAMAEDASRKRHSTVGGALGVARQARPGVTVLTHFSQRYSHMTSAAKIADSADSSAPGSGPVLLALDGMQLPVDAPQCIALASQVRRVYRVVCARSHE
ncbi:hypothetical protein FNF28_05418 [Cafeteria roenbergensis]|uniref:ribonuclease Z n=1 Tax=Cafeteria roenbergensis TaxID=33653 RepID=A0A5A8D533_CAFRO|nr:hypothetical protein FNF28_05418 [Cafeteria roenbergensis]